MTKKISLLLICAILYCAFFSYLPPLQVAKAASITQTKPAGHEYEIATLMACDLAIDDPKITVSTAHSHETNVTRGNPSRTGNFLNIPKHDATTLTVTRAFTAPHDVHFSTIIPKDQLYIVLDLYVDNLDFTAAGQLEISSGGKADVNEWAWEHKNLGYKAGWNTIYIPLSTHGGNGLIDGHINFCRWYTTTNSPNATYYFQSIRLVWFAPSTVTASSAEPDTTTSGTTTIYDETTNSHKQGTYKTYSGAKYDFDPDSPNHLLLADFTAANYSGTSITNVKAVGTNTGMDSSYYPPTVTATMEGGGTISKTVSTDAYKYLINGGATGVTMLNVSDDSLAVNPSNNSVKWGYTIKIPLGKHVDLTAYTHLYFNFWMSSYHYTNVNGSNKILPNTPGRLQLNLADSDRTNSPTDGINTTFNVGSFPADQDGLINHGISLRTPLYVYGYTQKSNGFAIKKPRTRVLDDAKDNGNGTNFVTTIGAIDTVVIRFYVETAHEEITAAPTLYLGRIWAQCETDTIQPGSPVPNTYEPEQYSFIQYTPPTHDPIVNYNGTKHNQPVIMADNYANPRNIYIRGLSYGDHRFSVPYMSWPWRFDCGKPLNTYFSQSVLGGGGNTSAGWTRKTGKWLSHNSYQRFGGTSAAAGSLTAVSN